MTFKKISRCRICQSKNFKEIINIGPQALTGVFPKRPIKHKRYPLILVQCQGKCGLVQLKHQYNQYVLFGETYGYRSGLNQSMVKHLKGIVKDIERKFCLTDKDFILDIGSNDATLLNSYSHGTCIGIEPNKKFNCYYKWPIFNDFYPSKKLANLKFKIITSIAMFYDVEEPLEFMKAIYNNLVPGGIWIFEVAFWPITLKNTSYDTICHEHACYYDLPQIKYIARMTGFKIININYNDTNGGSIRVTVQR